MALRMTSATIRRDSSYKQVQKRVPADIVRRAEGRSYLITLPAFHSAPEVVVEITIRKVINFSLRVRDPSAAKARISAFNAQLEQIFASLRSPAIELSHKKTVALSGEVYRHIVEIYEEDPGAPEDWEAWKAFHIAAMDGRVPNPPTISWDRIKNERQKAFGNFYVGHGPNFLEALDLLPTGDNARSLEVRFGILASYVLAKHGLEVTPASRLKLLMEIANAALDAGWRMKRAAGGDYSPDPNAQRFPEVGAVRNSKLTWDDLFDRWSSEVKPAGSTQVTWRAVIVSLRAHLKSEFVEDLTREKVVSWKSRLISQNLAVGTINGSYFAGLHALLNFSLKNRLITENRATGIKIRGKRQAGTRKLPYEDSEIAQLLAFSAQETNAARRWIPLLAVCTGARAGELAQLWSDRVREVNGIVSMIIRPAEDGGSLKNEGSERVVPVHAALIESGFLDFVASKKGPLFYGRVSGKGLRHPTKGVVNHLGDWIRKLPGFDDPRKSPNHAIRHWFKTTASRSGIPDSIADAIQGHVPQGDAAGYRHFDQRDFARELKKIIVPRI